MVTARQLRHTNLARGQQLWRDGVVEWEDGLRLGVAGGRDAVGAMEPCALVAHPMRQKRVGIIVDPLVEQGGNLPAQVGRAIQPGQFVAFE